jgi:hypothetical protein
LISYALKKGRISLLAPEGYEVCGEYGIGGPPFRLAETVESAVQSAKVIGCSVVMMVAGRAAAN